MRKNNTENMKMRGFFRIQIEEDGKVVGDSGWRENQILDQGIQLYLVNAICGNSPVTVSHMAIGIGGAPASNATTIAGQVASGKRQAVTTSAVGAASGTAQFTAAFASSDVFLPSQQDIKNVGLVDRSLTSAGTFLAGASFTSSTISQSNNLNITYQIRFAGA